LGQITVIKAIIGIGPGLGILRITQECRGVERV